jgi:transcriptional regulator with XRE-family HTH domain
MEIRKLIGNRILELRREKGLSQEALANIAEVDRTYMTGVETGKRNISVEILFKIIVALGTNYKDFFNHHSFSDE